MKKAVIKTIVVILMVIAIPLSMLIMAFSLPAQFSYTYYGALPKMYQRLKAAEGKKIVIIGCSGVAFGVNTELLQEQFNEYMVCPFGLYGAIGTKAMMELSKVNIEEGNIVILAPELGEQSLSTYFNGEHVYMGADGYPEMLSHVAWEDIGSMIEAMPSYLSKKFEYWQAGEPPKPTGVYTASSFNENCNMVYDRPCNIMEGGYDKGELPSYDTNIIKPAFLDYVNEYNEYVTKRGATLVYAFTPVNAASIPLDTTQEDVDVFYNYLTANLNFPILGNPHDYIMDCEWFYDSNVHCNTTGAVVYTRQLTKDLKVYLGDTTPTKIEIPEKPALPDENETMGGENKDAQYFIYEETKNGVQIIGLTEEGAKQTALILPTTYNDMQVTGFLATTFAGNSVIEEIRLQRNIRSIENGSFSGCTNLKGLYLAKGETPSRCKVNTGFLEGAERLKIYVEKDKLVDYINDYFWSRYAANIVGY